MMPSLGTPSVIEALWTLSFGFLWKFDSIVMVDESLTTGEQFNLQPFSLPGRLRIRLKVPTFYLRLAFFW